MRLVVCALVLGKRAWRGALKLLKRPARFERRLVPKRGMRSDGVVIVAPERQVPAGVVQCIEDLLVQECVAQAAIEAFDEGALPGLGRVDVMPGRIVLVSLRRGW